MTPYAICPKEVFHDRTISANAKALCGLISTYETAENKRWITLRQVELAEILSVTRETVNRLVKQLVARGHLETRNATTIARGRIALQYRVRHDLADDADAVIQALTKDEKKTKKTADVTPASHEEADVMSRSQADVRDKSHPPPEVTPASPHIGPDVIQASLPNKDNTKPSTEETDTNGSLFFVEGAMPKRRSKAWQAEIERVTETLWQTWPSVARKRHTRQAVFDAVQGVLTNIKLGARGDDLIRAGRNHVAERMASGAGYVKGLVPFIAKGLWQNWLEEDAPNADQAPIATAAEWRRRLANFEHDGSWSSSYGPRPGQQGYAGPPLSSSKQQSNGAYAP